MRKRAAIAAALLVAAVAFLAFARWYLAALASGMLFLVMLALCH